MHPLLPALLRLLADGHFHSGTVLAQHLGVSRSLVWQLMQAVQSMGLPVQQVRGKGYRLAHAVDWLDADRINQDFQSQGSSLQCQVCWALDSTNRHLLRQEPPADAMLLVAEWQSAGRGRLGRRWSMPLAGGLCCSLAWQWPGPTSDLAGLSLAAGVALVQMLRTQGLPAQVKWPNDVLVHGKKLAGILIEVRGDALGPTTVVLGVGLNLHWLQAPEPELQNQWIDAWQAGWRGSRHQALVQLGLAMEAMWRRFTEQGFAGFHQDWEQLHAYQHQVVDLWLHGEPAGQGQVLGVNAQGSLLLQTGSEVRTVSAGEISVRPARGPAES